MFDVFQCILVGDSKGELTVYQLRSMPEPPANQVCLSVYIVWQNTMLIYNKRNLKNSIHGLIPQANCALHKQKAFTWIFTLISYYLNFKWNSSNDIFMKFLLLIDKISSRAVDICSFYVNFKWKFLVTDCVEIIPSKLNLINGYDTYNSTFV